MARAMLSAGSLMLLGLALFVAIPDVPSNAGLQIGASGHTQFLTIALFAGSRILAVMGMRLSTSKPYSGIGTLLEVVVFGGFIVGLSHVLPLLC